LGDAVDKGRRLVSQRVWFAVGSAAALNIVMMVNRYK